MKEGDMRRFISGLALGVLVCTIWLYPGFADAAPPNKYNITVTGSDAEVNIRIVGQNATVYVNDDELATVAWVLSLQKEGSAADLETFLAARRADKWVTEVGIFLPEMIVWHMIKTGEKSVELKDIGERLAAAEATVGNNTEEIAIHRGELDAQAIKDAELEEKFEALQQELLDLEERWMISIAALVFLLLILAVSAGAASTRRKEEGKDAS